MESRVTREASTVKSDHKKVFSLLANFEWREARGRKVSYILSEGKKRVPLDKHQYYQWDKLQNAVFQKEDEGPKDMIYGHTCTHALGRVWVQVVECAYIYIYIFM